MTLQLSRKLAKCQDSQTVSPTQKSREEASETGMCSLPGPAGAQGSWERATEACAGSDSVRGLKVTSQRHLLHLCWRMVNHT